MNFVFSFFCFLECFDFFLEFFSFFLIESIIFGFFGRDFFVIFISSEIEEVVRNSTRAVVLRERRHCGEIAGSELTASRLMQTMAGGHVPHE